MKNQNSKICIFILGILGYSDKKHLSKFNVGRRTLSNLLEEDVIKKHYLMIGDTTEWVYFLSNKGIRQFKKYYSHYELGKSRSMVHDYIHSNIILDYANTIDELYTYTNEKAIRNKLREEIKSCELQLGISIGCPDCSIIINGKKLYIETILTRGKERELKKKNFRYVIEDDAELIIYKSGKKGGEHYEKENRFFFSPNIYR